MRSIGISTKPGGRSPGARPTLSTEGVMRGGSAGGADLGPVSPTEVTARIWPTYQERDHRRPRSGSARARDRRKGRCPTGDRRALAGRPCSRFLASGASFLKTNDLACAIHVHTAYPTAVG